MSDNVSYHDSDRPCPPTKIEVNCDSTILSIKHVFSWIISITFSVTIVIVVTWTMIVGGVRTCAEEIRESGALVYYEEQDYSSRRSPAPPKTGPCGTIITIINHITISITNHITNVIITILQQQPVVPPPGQQGAVDHGPFPLALGGDDVLIEIEDYKRDDGVETIDGCARPVIGIEVDTYDDNADGDRDSKTRPLKTKYREEDLDLPPFCEFDGEASKESLRRYWSLLDRPRVHATRTYHKDRQPQPGPDKQAHPADVNKPIQTGAPYAVFTAMQKGNPNLVKVFILYVDFVTEKPTIIEIPFESLRGRNNVISGDGKIHLVNNLKLDSLKYRVTFQIGSGVRNITIAGYDFGPESTDNADGANQVDVRDRDASGSYVACLTENGGISRVFRVDQDARGFQQVDPNNSQQCAPYASFLR